MLAWQTMVRLIVLLVLGAALVWSHFHAEAIKAAIPRPVAGAIGGFFLGFVLFAWRPILQEAVRAWSRRGDPTWRSALTLGALGTTLLAVVVTIGGLSGVPLVAEDTNRTGLLAGGMLGALCGVLLQIVISRSER